MKVMTKAQAEKKFKEMSEELRPVFVKFSEVRGTMLQAVIFAKACDLAAVMAAEICGGNMEKVAEVVSQGINISLKHLRKEIKRGK